MIIKFLPVTMQCKCSQCHIQFVFTPRSLHSSSQMADNNSEDILMDPLTLMGRMPFGTCEINFSAQMLSHIICFFFPVQPPHQFGNISKRLHEISVLQEGCEQKVTYFLNNFPSLRVYRWVWFAHTAGTHSNSIFIIRYAYPRK